MTATRPPSAATDALDVAGGPAVAHLEVARPVRVDPVALRGALAHPDWLGRLIDPPADRPKHVRVETDLAFRLGGDGRTLTFAKAAVVEFGPVRETPDGHAADVCWQATSFAPLFPVFAGRLLVNPTGLRILGKYAPPGGEVGLLVDRAILHHFAQRTAGWLLERLRAELAR